MNYLYINAIVNETYRNLNCASAFPQTHLERIVNLSINDGVLTSNVPGILTFFSVKEADMPILVLSRVLRHRHTASVGRMIQSIGWAWGKDVMTQELDNIFDAAFYTEEEVLAMGQNGTAVPLPRDKEVTPIAPLPELGQAVKAALLNGLFRRWLLNEPAMRVAVPKTADYNAYVISAVKTIYRILPVGLRAEAGFCSYTPDPGNIMSRVYIGFIPEAIADSNTLFLDGSNQSALNTYATPIGVKPLDTLIAYLSALPDAQLQSFLMKIYQEVESDGNAQTICELTAKSYTPIGKALQIITSNASIASQITTWGEFLRNASAYTPTMQEEIRNFIRRNATAEALGAHLRNFCAERNSAEELFQALCAYEEFVKNNPELGAPLWETTLALCKEKNCTVEAMDQATAPLLEKLAVFAEKAQLDAIFMEARRKEFAQLQAASTQDTLAIQERLSEAKLLLNKIAKRQAVGAEALEAEINAYQDSLASQNSDLVLQHYQSKRSDLIKRYNAQQLTTLDLIKNMYQLIEEMRTHQEAAALSELKEQVKNEYSVFIVHYYEEELNKLLQNIPSRLSEIRQRIVDVDVLLRQMRESSEAAALTELIKKGEQAKAELDKKAASSNTKLSAFYESIESSTSYFAVLDALDKTDLGNLDPEDRTDLESKLRSRRPKSYQRYTESFRSFYKKQLSLQAISTLREDICKRILEDLCAMDAISISFEKGTDPQKFLRELEHVKYLAKFIANKTGVAVTVEKSPNASYTVDADRFPALLDASLKGKLDADEAELEEVLFILMEYGVYKGNTQAMEALYELFRQNNWRMVVFTGALLLGYFGPQDGKVYTALFEKILKNVKRGNVRQFVDDANDILKDEASSDRTACRCFNKVADVFVQREERQDEKKRERKAKRPAAEEQQEGQPEEQDDLAFIFDQPGDASGAPETPEKSSDEKPSRRSSGRQPKKKTNTKLLLGIAIGVLAVILVALLVIVIPSCGKDGSETPPANTETTAPTVETTEATLPAYESITAEMLFGADGETVEFTNIQEPLLSWKDNADINNSVLAQHYLAGTNAHIATLQGISWDEYVFWELWVLCNNQVTKITEESFDTRLEDSLAEVYALVYATESVETEPTEETTAPTEETTAPTVETTETTTETTAPVHSKLDDEQWNDILNAAAEAFANAKERLDAETQGASSN